MRIQRVWKAAALLAVGAAGGGAALAVASVPDSNGVIHACVGIDASGKPTTDTGPNLRIVDPGAGQTCNTVNANGGPPSEANLAWNTLGATGPRGARGARGPAITIAGGNTLTISGGQVITVGGSHGVTINTPTITPNSRPIGNLKLPLGGAPTSLQIYSWSFGTGTSATGGGGGAGKSPVHEIVITKTQDASSPKLSKACATGEHFKTVVLSVRKAGGGGGGAGSTFLTIKLTDVTISSYQLSSGGDRPTESLTLNFTKIEYK
jgi:type VI secretion system Hcp family effector